MWNAVGPMRSFRERSPWLVGTISLIAILLGLGLAFSINKFQALRGVYAISADLEDAAGLRSGNEVRVAGVRVGQVTGIELTSSSARVEMEIASDIELPTETTVEVKLKTLLGQKFIDLQIPEGMVDGPGASILGVGDVIPMDQTTIPFDIYQAATEGTSALEEIDKDALRDLLDVMAGTFEGSGDELRRALVGLDEVGRTLGEKSPQITRLLKNLKEVTGTLDAGGADLGGVLDRSAEVLGTLASNRSAISSLLVATEDLGRDLGTLIQVARGSLQLGVSDLDSLLAAAEEELGSLEKALSEIAISQRLFAAPGGFGRFVEGNACAVTTADTCVPDGSPTDPGLPVHNVQPSPSPRGVTR